MALRYDDDREVTYEIVEEIGVISSQPTGWTRELNLVSWNGGQPKYDIREWSPSGDRMSRGITLNEREMRLVIDLLRRRSRGRVRRIPAAQAPEDQNVPQEKTGPQAAESIAGSATESAAVSAAEPAAVSAAESATESAAGSATESAVGSATESAVDSRSEQDTQLPVLDAALSETTEAITPQESIAPQEEKEVSGF